MGDNDGLNQSADEASLLITCLRGESFVVPHNMDWHSLLGLATVNGVLHHVYQAFQEEDIAMPDFFEAAVEERSSVARLLAAELEDLLQHLADHKIEVLPLKGPVLAETLYGDAAMRASNDLDLLVHCGDFPRAEALLFDLGFVACSEADTYHRRFVRGEVSVELHFGIAPPLYFPFDQDGIWSRARRGEFRGKPIRVMAEDDLVLFLCLHGLKHTFSKLIWILDVAQALGTMRHDGYEVLTQHARQQGQEPCLMVCCEVVREMLPQRLPHGMGAVIARSSEAAAKARRFAARLFAGDMEQINNSSFWSLYLQLEPSARKRWFCRLNYFAPTAADYQWAESHRINRGLALFLRPFRLLRKYGPLRAWQIVFPPAVK
jgi:hypothetical protein